MLQMILVFWNFLNPHVNIFKVFLIKSLPTNVLFLISNSSNVFDFSRPRARQNSIVVMWLFLQHLKVGCGLLRELHSERMVPLLLWEGEALWDQKRKNVHMKETITYSAGWVWFNTFMFILLENELGTFALV